MKYESREEIRRSVGVGIKYPLYLGAIVRARLAFQSHQMQKEILGNSPLEKSEELKKN